MRPLLQRALALVTTFAGLVIAASIPGCGSPDGASQQAHCDDHLACLPGDLLAGCGRCVRAAAALDIGACTKGMSTARIESALALSGGFVDSMSLLTDGVRRGDVLTADVRYVFVALGYNPARDALPAPFTFDGKGTYSTALIPGRGSQLQGSFLFGADYQVGKKGDVIQQTLFRTDSYLEGATVQILGSGVAEVAYEQPGPLVELLGYGLNPEGPFQLGYVDAEDELMKATLDSRIVVDETARGGGVVRFQAHRQSKVLAPEHFGEQPDSEWDPIELTSSEISNKSLGQTAAITSWALQSFASSTSDPPAGPKGTLQLRVSGGAFSHVVTIVFDAANRLPTATWTCAD